MPKRTSNLADPKGKLHQLYGHFYIDMPVVGYKYICNSAAVRYSCTNAIHSLTEVKNNIDKVGNLYNRQKLTQIYNLLEPFIRKYNYCSPKILNTPEFAKDYQPIASLMSKQVAGKKLFCTYVGDVINGTTKYVHWIFSMPTMTQGDLSIMSRYSDDLLKEKEKISIDIGIQCVMSDIPLKLVVDKAVDTDDGHDDDNNDSGHGTMSVSNDTASPITADVATPNAVDDTFSSSDGEIESMMAQIVINTSVDNSTPTQTKPESPLTAFFNDDTDEQPPTPPSRAPKLQQLGRQSAVDYSSIPHELAVIMPSAPPSPIASDTSFEEIDEDEIPELK